jgi:hypothetical protein
MKRLTEITIRTETSEIVSVRRSVIRRTTDATCGRDRQHIERTIIPSQATAQELESQESVNETD